MQFIG